MKDHRPSTGSGRGEPVEPRGYTAGIWVELVAFDETRRDCGVRDYIATLGFTPDFLSILVCCADFVHEYDGKIDGTPLRAEFCSLNARAKGSGWTRARLRDFIAACHRAGTRVFLGLMGELNHPDFEARSAFAAEHPELVVVDREGNRGLWPEGRFAGLENVNPLARFNDGTPYREFFAEKLVRVLVDYGFDGFQGADGYKSLLKPLEFADFSEGSLRAFRASTGIEPPDPPKSAVSPPAGGSAVSNPKSKIHQARWIWAEARGAWIEFYRQGWDAFWKHVVGRCHEAGKEVIVNSPWPTDPVGGLGRFGVDYRSLAEAGVDGLVFEHSDALVSVLGAVAGPASEQPDGYVIPWEELFAEFASAQLLINVYEPRLALLPFTATHDRFERWDVLRFERPYMEKSFLAGATQFVIGASGDIRRCVRGTTVCLGDDIEPEEWRWIRRMWDLGHSAAPARPAGPVLVFSDEVLRREVGEEERWSTHRILYSLIAAGFPVICAVRLEDLAGAAGSVRLVVNPASWPDAELARVFGVSPDETVILLGYKKHQTGPPFPLVELEDPLAGLSAGIFGRLSERLEEHLGRFHEDLHQRVEAHEDLLGFRTLEIRDPSGQSVGRRWELVRKSLPEPYELLERQRAHFLTRIPNAPVPPSFLRLAVALLAPIAWQELREVKLAIGDGRFRDVEGRVAACLLELPGDVRRLVLYNHLHRAAWTSVRFWHEIACAEAVGLHAMPVRTYGDRLEVVVPPNGAQVVDIRMTDDRFSDQQSAFSNQL